VGEREGPIIVRSKDSVGAIRQVDDGAWKYNYGEDEGEEYVCEAG
jgi:hypothetical protein